MLFATELHRLREEKQLLQRQIAAVLEIDTPMYSKIERGDRRAKRCQVIAIADYLQTDKDRLLTLWLADQVIEIVKEDINLATGVFEAALNVL